MDRNLLKYVRVVRYSTHVHSPRVSGSRANPGDGREENPPTIIPLRIR